MRFPWRRKDWRRHEYAPKKEATIVKCAAWDESAVGTEARTGNETRMGEEAGMRAKTHLRSATKTSCRRGASEQSAQNADDAQHS